jgi:hypothetical protein
MAVMTRDLEDPWDALYQSIGAFGDQVISTVSRAMEWAVNHLGKYFNPPDAYPSLSPSGLAALTVRHVNRTVSGSRFWLDAAAPGSPHHPAAPFAGGCRGQA